MTALKIVVLFLGCSLAWGWIDMCGADLGLGEALPFCVECSGLATTARLLLLGLAIWCILKLLRREPEYTQVQSPDTPPAHTIRVHWHRIALLLALVAYPLWIAWVDRNTIIPGPDAFWLTRASCRYPGVKGTVLWGIVLTFVVLGSKVLHTKMFIDERRQGT